ncbi:MAG: hypothetical protein ACHBN1_27225 [Heteroscytonema crispum UTEX LB 1556]
MNLNHPFALDISDLEDLTLDFEEQLTDEETAQIGGGTGAEFTTLALGPEGGHPGDIVCISAPCPGSESGGEPSPKPPKPLPKPPKPPVYTKAWFETGGGPYTKALHETGGSETFVQ